MDHGVGVPPVRVQGREHGKAARGAMPGPARRETRTVTAREALAFPAAAPERGLSTGEWLGRWLASWVSLRPATLHRIHATLRAVLNGAVRAGLIAVNPGRFPELPRAARPRPQVWTPAPTERWQAEGWRSAVGVWTAAQTAQFLRQVRGHRLYALFHLTALRGLRRGEAAGLT